MFEIRMEWGNFVPKFHIALSWSETEKFTPSFGLDPSGFTSTQAPPPFLFLWHHTHPVNELHLSHVSPWAHPPTKTITHFENYSIPKFCPPKIVKIIFSYKSVVGTWTGITICFVYIRHICAKSHSHSFWTICTAFNWSTCVATLWMWRTNCICWRLPVHILFSVSLVMRRMVFTLHHAN